MHKQQQGFTLIELVIVIVILGILAATALPRFINVTSDAHEAAVAGAGGGFGSAVQLAHAQFVAKGLSSAGAMDMDGDGTDDVYMSDDGWPVGGGGDDATLDSDADCVNIWQGLMQNPPSMAESGSVSGEDYAADGTSTAGTCEYTYQGTNNLSITYDSANGSVTVDDDSSS